MESSATAETSRAGSLPLVGKELALDFANTASGRGTATHRDHLVRPEHVVAWACHAKVLTAADAERALRALARSRRSAAKLLASALALRDLIYAIGAAAAAKHDPEEKFVQQLTRMHGECVSRARLIPMAGTFVWTWNPAEAPAEAILGPITLSALTLLTQADLSRIKQCAGDSCGWLFFDTTKNKSRRWCEMEVCGNRAKQRRFHSRHRGDASHASR